MIELTFMITKLNVLFPKDYFHWIIKHTSSFINNKLKFVNYLTIYNFFNLAL